MIDNPTDQSLEVLMIASCETGAHLLSGTSLLDRMQSSLPSSMDSFVCVYVGIRIELSYVQSKLETIFHSKRYDVKGTALLANIISILNSSVRTYGITVQLFFACWESLVGVILTMSKQGRTR